MQSGQSTDFGELTWKQVLFLQRLNGYYANTGRMIFGESDFQLALKMAISPHTPVDDILQHITDPDSVVYLRKGVFPHEIQYLGQSESELMEQVTGNDQFLAVDVAQEEPQYLSDLVDQAKLRRAKNHNRKRSDHDVSRHPRDSKYRERRVGLFEVVDGSFEETSEASHEHKGTTHFLTRMGFDPEDIGYLQIAYGSRAIDIRESPKKIDLLKVSIDNFVKIYLSMYRNVTIERARTDFVNYLEILNSTWTHNRAGVANSFLRSGQPEKLHKKALEHYEGMVHILNNTAVRFIDPNAETALRSAVYLFEKYSLRKTDANAPTLTFTYGAKVASK